MKFLLLEDDRDLGRLIRDEIENKGFQVDWFQSIKDAKSSMEQNSYDLAILDLYLPDGKGFDIVPDCQFPVIMMSALSGPDNRLRGAELGVIDFIPKPFLIKELFIKVERALGEKIQTERIWKYKGITLDLNKRQITSGEETHLLNKRDFRLLEILSQKHPNVVTRDEIMDYLYGKDQNPSHRTIDNAVVRVRQMLNDDDHQWIRSVRGEGYQWQIERQ